jgi:hypothetical protein
MLSNYSSLAVIFSTLTLCTSCNFISPEKHEKATHQWYNQKIQIWETKLNECKSWCNPINNTLVGLKSQYAFFKSLPKEARGKYNPKDYGF